MPRTRVRSSWRDEPPTNPPDLLQLSSSSVLDGEPIPTRHSALGGNLSPALLWSEPPLGTVSVAVSCEDPRGPHGRPFTLWILFNIPATRMGIPEGISKVLLPDIVPGAQQGLNDTGQVGYDGPKPPPGHAAHRYEFRVYALDATLQLTPGATRLVFRAAIQDHVLARGKLVGTFSR